MLHLKKPSQNRWLKQVDESIDEMLIDHAHCEGKAASTAMNLMNSYTENIDLCREMATIIEEELEHYFQVMEILDSRSIKFRRLASGPYGRKLNSLVRSTEPDRAVDRLLVASLIEARSCERFSLLAEHVKDRDPELAEFYASLFESEARHHSTYVRLAEHFADRESVRARLDQLSLEESRIIDEGSDLPRMHS